MQMGLSTWHVAADLEDALLCILIKKGNLKQDALCEMSNNAQFWFYSRATSTLTLYYDIV